MRTVMVQAKAKTKTKWQRITRVMRTLKQSTIYDKVRAVCALAYIALIIVYSVPGFGQGLTRKKGQSNESFNNDREVQMEGRLVKLEDGINTLEKQVNSYNLEHRLTAIETSVNTYNRVILLGIAALTGDRGLQIMRGRKTGKGLGPVPGSGGEGSGSDTEGTGV